MIVGNLGDFLHAVFLWLARFPNLGRRCLASEIGFWVEAVSKFSLQRLAKHLDRYQRFYSEDGQQVRINQTARRHIPEVTAVRTASLSSLSFVSVICANYAARLHPIMHFINHSPLCSNFQCNKLNSSVMVVHL